MNKRILILANNSDGLYGFRRELIARLARENEVFASTPNDGYFDELRALGCTVMETPIDRRGINPVTDAKLLLHYVQLLRQVKPDLVITYTIKPNVYGGMACRLLGVLYATNITGLGTAFQKKGALRALVTVLYRRALKRAKVVFFENAGNRDTLIGEGIVREVQCRLLMGAGVNLAHYVPAEYPAEEPVQFLFIGRVMREKGVEELFSAMERLRGEGHGCVLNVVGDFEEDYASAIRAYEAAGWLRYHGYQKDVRPFIAQSHCFVLPSYHEGMANTNLECAAMARPVITSRIHGCMEAVEEGASGYLCAAQDAESLYTEMKRFLTLTAGERAEMGRAGRRRMEAVFDKEKVVDATVEGLGV